MRRARSLRLLVGVAVTSLVLAACGSSSDDNGDSDTTADTQTSQEESAEPDDADAGDAADDDDADADADSDAPAEPDDSASDGPVAKIGLAYDLGGRGDQSFNDSAARGLDKAIGDGMELIAELTAQNGEPDQAKIDRLNQLVKDGADTIVAVGFAYAGPLGEVAPQYPDVNFGIVDDASLCTGDAPLPNVDCMTFAEHEGSFLVGAAAALKSQTGKVGFIGGVDVPLIQKFQAGFDAGAKAVNPDIVLSGKYITQPPDFGGFNDPASGERIAKGMYDDDFDVIYAAAGGSGAGVFKAAQAAGAWGIGVDSDQYLSPSLEDVKDVIMTSMIKNIDVAVYDFFSSANSGTPLTGEQVYNLASGGVGYSVSGGFVDDITAQLDEFKEKIISGEIEVPAALG